MAVDAQTFMEITPYLNVIWSGPFQICVSVYFLWMTLGPSVLAGVAVMVLLIPINSIVAKRSRALQILQMKFKDNRIKLMNEILNGIKVLKLYSWEKSFQEKVHAIRKDELKVKKQSGYLQAIGTFTWTCAPFLVSLTTFAVYVLSDENNVLDAEKAFVSLALFNIIKFPMSVLPMMVTVMVQMSVSLKRLRTFLLKEELNNKNVDYSVTGDVAVSIEDGSFAWGCEDGSSVLHGLNISIPEGQLVAIVGIVGSGKSSLLSAILGETQKVHGNVTVKGSVAYVAQQAWIQNATLRENILFGKDHQDLDYSQILSACALDPDLEVLPAGDLTEIGEKGINLSGGQKQRVSLARAVYQDADVYLLDDPLSAVDAHVGKHIFDQVVGPKGLLQKKTRVLVTHGISFLPQVDHILVIKDGVVSESGTYRELLHKDGAFAEFLKNYSEEENDCQEDENINLTGISDREDNSLADTDERDACQTNGSISSGQPPGVLRSVSSETKVSLKTIKSVNKADDIKADKLVMEEESKTGRVKFSVLLAYLRAMGFPLCIIIVLFHTVNNAISLAANFWLSAWSNDKTVNGSVDTSLRDLRLGVYGALGLGQGIAILFVSIIVAMGTVAASASLHTGLLWNILRSPMEFFDVTPIGRIVNRFSKDIDMVDTLIPQSLNGWLRCILIVVETVFVICINTPIFLVIIIPLGIFFFFVQRFYVTTSRQLKRLESVSRSPIYSHFGETIQGASTIRAYRMQKRFVQESQDRVDHNLIYYYPSIVANRWLAVRLEFVSVCILLFTSLFAVVYRKDMTGGIVGLMITYTLNVTQMLNWTVRLTSEMETNIISVERVEEYTKTPTEAAWEMPDTRPDSTWPQKGLVDFQSYSTRYRQGLDLVLKDVTCQIQPGEKVGIVGRTGAGKSSLTMALFRIIEAAGGAICIDGLKIADLGLHDLRSKITIIPQDPVLFSGSLRMNLDPFDTYSDDAIWLALEHAHLKVFVRGLTEGLLYECSEGGENLSVGQRQLVCLARALLRKTKILILDEATAAVDLETDDLIQSTIRTEFEGATVLTIAHRINTIMDYDRIIVLDEGRIAEMDSPQTLLNDIESAFYSLAKDAGLVEQQLEQNTHL